MREDIKKNKRRNYILAMRNVRFWALCVVALFWLFSNNAHADNSI